MKPRRACLLVVMLAIGLLVFLLGREPHYSGRSLTSWLEQCNNTPLNETQKLLEAQNAIRAIGAKKALPTCLNLVAAADDPVSLWVIDKTEKYRDRFLRWKSAENYSYDDWRRSRWHSAEDFEQLGMAGFEVLGTNAAPAVGELEKLLGSQAHTRAAQYCLVYIGQPAEPVFCRALTNQDARIRQWAMDQLAGVTEDVVVYIARIQGALHDPSDAVRTEAVDDIGIQTSAPELAVPLLITALQDHSNAVRAHAARSLANFGTNALVTFLTLSNLVENDSADTAGAALQTLIILAPDRALPLLTNGLAHEMPGANEALKSLQQVDPETAWPLIFQRLLSPATETRRAAFRLLCKYTITPPIAAALQIAASDPESTIAEGAKRLLTEQYQKTHPHDSPFGQEPVYAGKTLGEWLQMRGSDGGLAPAATNAIYLLGTNAIPALLRRLSYLEPPFGLRTEAVNLARRDGMNGLFALGDAAIPAIPQLQSLMDCTNEDTVLYAMVCSLATGTNALPTLAKGLTNRIANVRGEAAHSLAESIAIPCPEYRSEIIALLTKQLSDIDSEVRENIKTYLQEIDAVAPTARNK